MPRPGFIEASVDELVLHWFDIEDVPRLIVDPALTIKWLNVRAERELQRRRDVLRRGDLLMTCNPAHQVELIALLARRGNEAATLCLRSEAQDRTSSVEGRWVAVRENIGVLLNITKKKRNE